MGGLDGAIADVFAVWNGRLIGSLKTGWGVFRLPLLFQISHIS